MDNPYTKLPGKAFWRMAVAQKNMMEINELWFPKFPIDQSSRIATFGSCFAQHFGSALRKYNFGWIDAEPAPVPLSAANINRFGYGQFSSRTANIYTTSLLKQWASWAMETVEQPDNYWEQDGRIYDPFRPSIEPNGFESVEEMRRSRQVTVEAFANVIKAADVFVFTLGLTESWFDKDGGFEYPMCPGTIAGEFNKDRHIFNAQGFSFIYENLKTVIADMREINSELKFLLTVSPVPLTATNSGQHVLVASSASKAILRAVAETIANDNDFVDYFPSYEIINSPVFKGRFFKPNLRQVQQNGVNFVMKNFFDGIGFDTEISVERIEESKDVREARELAKKLNDIACEEEILAAFANHEGAK